MIEHLFVLTANHISKPPEYMGINKVETSNIIQGMGITVMYLYKSLATRRLNNVSGSSEPLKQGSNESR